MRNHEAMGKQPCLDKNGGALIGPCPLNHVYHCPQCDIQFPVNESTHVVVMGRTYASLTWPFCGRECFLEAQAVGDGALVRQAAGRIDRYEESNQEEK